MQTIIINTPGPQGPIGPSGSSGSYVIPVNEIVFGDSSSSITSTPYFTFTPNGEMGGAFNIEGSSGSKTTSIYVEQANGARINLVANHVHISSLTFRLDGSNDLISLIGGVTRGIFYAGPASIGLTSLITGSGIDLKNDIYTLGNPSTNILIIKSTAINIKECPAYDDDVAAGVGGLITDDVYQTTGNGVITTAGVLMIKQ